MKRVNYSAVPLLIIVLTLVLSFCGAPPADPQIIFEENGRKGLVDYNGEVILDSEFEGKLRVMHSGQALYNTGRTHYFIDENGRESKYGYTQATDFGSGYAFVVNPGEKISVIDTEYQVKRTLDYDEAEGFKGNLALVGKDGLYGVINKSFKEVLPCRYESVLISDQGDYILARNDILFHLFSRKGKEIMKKDHVILLPSEGMVRYIEGWEGLGGWGYFDMDGNKVIRANSERNYVSPFRNDYSTYLEDGLWGVLDKEGRKVIRAQYEFPVIFNAEGVALTAKRFMKGSGFRQSAEYKFGFIDTNNEEIIPFEYELAMPFHNNAAFVFDGMHWVVIDENNRQVHREEFSKVSLHPLHDLLAWNFEITIMLPKTWGDFRLDRTNDATRKMGSMSSVFLEPELYLPKRVYSEYYE